MVHCILLSVAAVSLATGCTTDSKDLATKRNMARAPIGAVGHYGPMTEVLDFYLNEHWGGNVRGWGGGGISVCCMLLPRKLTEPVMVNMN